MSNQTTLLLSPSPHMHSGKTTQLAMWGVCASLLPVLGTAVYLFGTYVLILTLVTCIGAVLAEAASLALRKRPWTGEVSSLVTGLILALTLPPHAPLWVGFVGGVIAIVLGKQVYGGTGANPFNPAAVGRVFLLVSFPAQLTMWTAPFDGVSTATPLGGAEASLWTLTVGTHGGSMGETSAIAILCGAVILFAMRLIDWQAPVGTVLGTALIALLVGEDPVYHVLTGGLLFGAVYMATDWVTSPVTKRGRFIFGLGIGVLTMVIRVWGSYPEGVSFAILLMNALTPLINRAELSLREKRRKAYVRATS
ncbi:MAG: RnfABCDGE type electron transport complex subunit D [Firmicutes bacterium]|nr:RnfABCDGE type electron transport complex subunit D [Bacillota bacterium]